MADAPPKFPLSGECDNCTRERDDLFFHEQDEAFYCVDVFRCEARLHILANRSDELGDDDVLRLA